jgi:hypothetical protein
MQLNNLTLISFDGLVVILRDTSGDIDRSSDGELVGRREDEGIFRTNKPNQSELNMASYAARWT